MSVAPVKHFVPYSVDERSLRASSHRMSQGQRVRLGYTLWTHPSVPGVGFPTRKLALEAAARKEPRP